MVLELERYQSLAEEDRRIVRGHIAELQKRIEERSKSMRWKVRAAIGERTQARAALRLPGLRHPLPATPVGGAGPGGAVAGRGRHLRQGHPRGGHRSRADPGRGSLGPVKRLRRLDLTSTLRLSTVKIPITRNE